jgi:ribosomal-protein-alanine N-acetyltransferase
MTRLETPHLTIRGFETNDLEGLYFICSDAEVMRFVGDNKPLTLEQCQKWIEVSKANYAHHNYGAMAVIENSSSKMIGYCGIVYGEDTTTPELIYGFAKNVWGKGYATEVANAMLEHGFQTVKLETILATADPENIASLKILKEKLGFQYTHSENDIHGLPTIFLKLERTDWLKSKPKLVST